MPPQGAPPSLLIELFDSVSVAKDRAICPEVTDETIAYMMARTHKTLNLI